VDYSPILNAHLTVRAREREREREREKKRKTDRERASWFILVISRTGRNE